METVSVRDFLKKISRSMTGKENIPLDHGAGLPMLEIAGDYLLVSVFYYRCVFGKNDTSRIYPPEIMISADYPSGTIARLELLRTREIYRDIDFKKPIGTFRHEAVKHLDRGGYMKKKEELYALLDRQIAYLGGEGAFTRDDAAELRSLYMLLAEPSLLPYYKNMSESFFRQFFVKEQ